MAIKNNSYVYGDKIRDLTFLSLLEKKDKWGNVYGLFRCNCGNKFEAKMYYVKQGDTSSCGCLHKIKIKYLRFKHGQSYREEYKIWRAMINRCYKKNNTAYSDYGGRGITVCDRWLNSFESFYADMGKRPSKEYSIERKNVNGNYDTSNCKWATTKEQSRNKRNNVVLTLDGESMCLMDWSIKTGIGHKTLSARIKMGLSPKEILTQTDYKSRPHNPKTTFLQRKIMKEAKDAGFTYIK